jgi:hypothetical protein
MVWDKYIGADTLEDTVFMKFFLIMIYGWTTLGSMGSLDTRIQDPRPESAGGAAAHSGGANASHRGPAAQDTADWRDDPGPGNMRVDYVLPSIGLEVTGSGVFWPLAVSPLARLIAKDPTGGRRPVSSDHRLVWVDIVVGR